MVSFSILGPFGPRRDTRPRLSREASRMVMTTPSRRRVDGVDVDGTPSRRRRARIKTRLDGDRALSDAVRTASSSKKKRPTDEAKT